jgi:hypothetical protein
MLQRAAIVFCDFCEDSTAGARRGWRAWITTGDDGEAGITVVCPACAEACFGEDESEWSG